jgi:hypothetical protein
MSLSALREVTITPGTDILAKAANATIDASTIQRMSMRTTDWILAEFETWATGQELPLAGSAEDAQRDPGQRTPIRMLLISRADFLDKPDPTCWRSGDVHALLMQVCPERMVGAWGVSTHSPAELREFLRFLDETGRLHPGSTRVRTLVKELERLTPNFGAAMADRSRWRLAKRVLTAIVDDGVDLDDPSAVDRWATAFSALSAEARRPVLGELMDTEPGLASGNFMIYDAEVVVLRPGQTPCRHLLWPYADCTCGECPSRAYPAVSLPDEAQLAKAVTADGSGLLACLAEFARWVGAEGRPVDQHGELKREAVRDAARVFGLGPDNAARLIQIPTLCRLWDLCLELRVLELRHARAVPGPGLDLADRVLSGEAPADEALAVWCDLFDAVSSPVQLGGGEVETTVRQLAAPWPPRFFAHLYARSPEGNSVGFAELMRDTVADHADEIPGSMYPVASRVAMETTQMALGHVVEHGGIHVSGWTPPVPVSGQAIASIQALNAVARLSVRPSVLRIRLTDLGRYAMRRQLLAAGAAAPLAES